MTFATPFISDGARAWRAARPWVLATLVLATWPVSIVVIVVADVVDAKRQASGA